MEFKRSEAFIDEGLGETQGEFLCYQIRISLLKFHSAICIPEEGGPVGVEVP
jgi:hypothetical protein